MHPPGCWDGKINLMAAMAGWSYSALLPRILEAAEERTIAQLGDGRSSKNRAYPPWPTDDMSRGAMTRRHHRLLEPHRYDRRYDPAIPRLHHRGSG